MQHRHAPHYPTSAVRMDRFHSASRFANRRSRTVTHNEGCIPRPKTILGKLVELGSAIDKLTNGMFIKN